MWLLIWVFAPVALAWHARWMDLSGMAQLETKAPATSFAKFKVMGKEFDPAVPDKYLASFTIRKAA